MYRQIRAVAREDTDYQRIVWRENNEQPIKEFRLLTVTIGTSCAPYLAVKTFRQLATDEKSASPIAVEPILNDFYVDDLVSGSDLCQCCRKAKSNHHCSTTRRVRT